MRNKLLICCAAAIGFLAVSSPMFAHHGQVVYERENITLKGSVTKFEWSNPHSVVSVAVKDEKNGTTEWHAEILPPAQMLRAGWTRDSIKPGDQVTLVGRPGKYSAHILWLEYLVTPDGRKLGRDSHAAY